MLTAASALGLFLVGVVVGAILVIFFWTWSMKRPGGVESFFASYFRSSKQAPAFLHTTSTARHPTCPMCERAKADRGDVYCTFHGVS